MSPHPSAPELACADRQSAGLEPATLCLRSSGSGVRIPPGAPINPDFPRPSARRFPDAFPSVPAYFCCAVRSSSVDGPAFRLVLEGRGSASFCPACEPGALEEFRSGAFQRNLRNQLVQADLLDLLPEAESIVLHFGLSAH